MTWRPATATQSLNSCSQRYRDPPLTPQVLQDHHDGKHTTWCNTGSEALATIRP